MPDYNNVKNKDFSIFGQNCVLKGEFHMSGIINISSDIEGDLFIQDEGKVYLEQNAKFTGNIKCQDIEIFGEFDGFIESNGTVILQPSARVNGRIKAANLSIYPGAQANIEGHAN
jgi:cytoskeletal protein CcmA (bactofilin family)